ncbi:MAG: hypothetical protein VW938_08805, partial [Synechococcus sp.]
MAALMPMIPSRAMISIVYWRGAPSMCVALLGLDGHPDHRLENLSRSTQFTKNTRTRGKLNAAHLQTRLMPKRT